MTSPQIASTSKFRRDALPSVVEHEPNHQPTISPSTKTERDAHQLGMRTYSNNDPLTFDFSTEMTPTKTRSFQNSTSKTREQDEDFNFGMDRNHLSMDSPADQYELENYWLGLSD
jgi:hypothetical protein